MRGGCPLGLSRTLGEGCQNLSTTWADHLATAAVATGCDTEVRFAKYEVEVRLLEQSVLELA